MTIGPGEMRPEDLTALQQTAMEAAFSIAYWLLFLLLNGYILLTRGQTIGKVLMGTRIVNLNGDIPGFGKLIFLRYLVPGFAVQIPCIGGVFGLMDCLFIFGQERRCIHDYIAGTKVINAKVSWNRLQVLAPSPELFNAEKLAPSEEDKHGPEPQD